MLVEKENARLGERRHDQRQRLALPAGKERHAVLEPVFEAEPEPGEPVAEERPPLLGQRMGEAAHGAAGSGDGEVLLDGELAAAPGERVLEDPRHARRAPRRRLAGDIGLVDDDPPGARRDVAGDGAEEGRLAGPVRADDADEFAGLDRQRQVVQRLLLERRPLAEGDGQVLDADHDMTPPLRSRGRISASATKTAVARLRSDGFSPIESEVSASWIARR